MKALSIKNPWAYLIFHGGKDIENRTYATMFRGKLLIHASKQSMYVKNCIELMPKHLHLSYDDVRNLCIKSESTNGLIIGSVLLVDCIPNSKSDWAQNGCWHWVLESPTLLPEPVPASGKLGFWEAGDYGFGVKIKEGKSGTDFW
jgi:hypothetical protein